MSKSTSFFPRYEIHIKKDCPKSKIHPLTFVQLITIVSRSMSPINPILFYLRRLHCNKQAYVVKVAVNKQPKIKQAIAISTAISNALQTPPPLDACRATDQTAVALNTAVVGEQVTTRECYRLCRHRCGDN